MKKEMLFLSDRTECNHTLFYPPLLPSFCLSSSSSSFQFTKTISTQQDPSDVLPFHDGAYTERTSKTTSGGTVDQTAPSREPAPQNPEPEALIKRGNSLFVQMSSFVRCRNDYFGPTKVLR